MERKKHKIIIALIYIFFGFGVFWHYLPATFELMKSITWVTLLLLAIFIIFFEFKESNNPKNLIIWILIGFSLTLTLEIVGTNTGLIFGPYNYGNILGPQIFSAPLIIGLNWVVVVLGCLHLTQDRLKNNISHIVVAAALAMGFDLVLEPVAIKLGYWNWTTEAGAIPIQNYIAWFGIALILGAIWKGLKLKVTSRLPKHALLAQLIFMFLLIWL